MASTPDFVDYVMQQMAPLGDVTCRKMFGEYGMHYQGKFFACICDNQLLLKITPAGQALLPKAPLQPPYPGASPYLLVEEVDDAGLLQRLVTETCAQLPPPRPKKKKR